MSARSVGTEAEDRAARHLLERGYTLVTRRWRRRGCEIDLIALDGDTLVFIEVKAARLAGFAPELKIDKAKRKAMVSATERYLSEFGLHEGPVRFDVIAIDPDGVRHHVDAFRPGSSGA